MRVLAIAFLATLIAATAASACVRRVEGERFTLSSFDPLHSSRVSVCDHRTGGGRLLAEYPSGWGPGNPPEIDDVAIHGNRAAWMTVTVRRTRATAVVSTVRLPRGRIHRRVVARRTFRNRFAPGLGVTYTASGALAYSVWDGGWKYGSRRRLVLGDRTIDRGEIGVLDTDDRWTLSWYEPESGLDPSFTDIGRPPLDADGCPVRERFAGDLTRFGDIQVRTAIHSREHDVRVTRVCRVGSGRDGVLMTWGDMETQGSGRSLRIVGGGDGTITYETTEGSRYDSCATRVTATVEVETMRTLRRESRFDCPAEPVTW